MGNCKGEHTYIAAEAKIDQFIALAAERAHAFRVRQELEAIHKALNTQCEQINLAIRARVQSLLDTLKDPINEIYAIIQDEKAIPIRLELPGENDRDQACLNLLVDFDDNRQGVK